MRPLHGVFALASTISSILLLVRNVKPSSFFHHKDYAVGIARLREG
jgi:hypothetical protein